MEFLVAFCDISTIGLCMICKIPQIIAIYKEKNVDGLSRSSLILEALSYAVSLCYNLMKGYPILSYLEDPFLVFQSLTVLFMVYHYSGDLNLLKFGTLGATIAIFYGLTLGLPHPTILPLLLTGTLPMKVFSKLFQIKEICVRKTAGNVSIASWIINIYTCVTRILTTVLVTKDQTLLVKHCLSLTLNSIVIVCAWYFGSDIIMPKEGEDDEGFYEEKRAKKRRKKKRKQV